jgi:fatty acid desaturase
MVVNAWLTATTWMHHTDVNVPHLDESLWTWILGALQTVDRPYHWILDILHHRIGTTHMMHHLVSTIPHYHAQEATVVLRTAFPHIFQVDPTPITEALWRVASQCVVSYDHGDGTHWFVPPPSPPPCVRADVWRIAGKSYDLTTFAAHHPGGANLIRDTKGADITYLVQSYHNGWSRQRLQTLVRTLEVPDETDWPPIAWDSKLPILQRDLRRVGVDVVRDKTPWVGVVYYTVMGLLYALSMAGWLWSPTPLCALCFGLLGFLWGGLLQHEGSHQALSRTPWINQVARYALFPWTSPGSWFQQHVIKHHQYTNTRMDEDVQTSPLIPVRHHHDSPWYLWHRAQLALELCSSAGVLLAIYPGWISLVQLAIVYLHWWFHVDLLCALLPMGVYGIVFILATQLAHINAASFPETLQAYPLDFVQHQVNTSVDYAHDNPVVTGVNIFLNYQTYHHLFPGMSHFQLYTKRHLIDRVLAMHDIVVRHVTLGSSIRSHWSYVYTLSKNIAPGTDRAR